MEYFDLMMRYEGDDTDAHETLTLFASLIQSGDAWALQGHYGRTAASFIEQGLISREGEITSKGHAWADGRS